MERKELSVEQITDNALIMFRLGKSSVTYGTLGTKRVYCIITLKNGYESFGVHYDSEFNPDNMDYYKYMALQSAYCTMYTGH